MIRVLYFVTPAWHIIFSMHESPRHNFFFDKCHLGITNALFGWRGERGGVEGSRVELVKNKLILY